MNAFHFVFVVILIKLSESASIPKKNDTLEILKKDVAHVGSAIEDFTFDILRQMIDNSEEQESTTVETRKKRSVEDEVRNLCQKRCDSAEKAEKQQIKDLKDEVKKLQDMVKLIQDQEKIIDILDQKNDTKQMRAETESYDETGPNIEELAKMKTDLKDVINKLNQTRELLNLQKEKDQILEIELINQKEEITNLKHLVDTILHNNTYPSLLRTSENKEGNRLHSSVRASEFSSLRKLLKSLPEDEDEGDEELRTKLLDLQKHLNKKRKQKTLLDDLKHLEKGFDDDTSGDNDLMRQLIAAIKKSEPKGRNDDVDITNLSELQEAINRLRPKENEADQFQAMLNKLINKPGNQRPSQITITPQQMNELTKKLTTNNTPYICIADDGGAKSNGYRVPVNPNFQTPPPIDHNKGQQFFPGQFTQPNYYPQGNANGAVFEKPLAYPTENVDYNQKYQEDLRQQIDGLQAAIDNLNKPEYLQRPEDKTVVDNLEKQIGDLRNIVNNLNYDPGYPRGKRSVDNNEVDNSKEMTQKMTKFVGKLLEKVDEKPNLEEIQSKINTIKKQLDSSNSNSKTRASSTYYNPLQYPSAQTDPTAQELTRSFKTDFLSEIIGKILDKVIEAIPAVLQKLFGFTIEQLTKDDGQDYDVQTLRKNLGIFAVLPIILLRIVKGITTFMNVLRKSSFFKNFLMPALILGTVAGAVLFLIWWLQPETTPSQQYNYIGGDTDSSQYSPPNQYPSSSNNQYPVSYNYPVYNRSYYNK